MQADAETRPAAAEIEMNEVVYIGLAVCSNAGPVVTAEATISSVTITGDVRPAGEFLWSGDIGFKLIALPDK